MTARKYHSFKVISKGEKNGTVILRNQFNNATGYSKLMKGELFIVIRG